MSESLLQAASAATGGMAATALLFPLETIKTRLQADRSDVATLQTAGTLETGNRILADFFFFVTTGVSDKDTSGFSGLF